MWTITCRILFNDFDKVDLKPLRVCNIIFACNSFIVIVTHFSHKYHNVNILAIITMDTNAHF
jgi:hypothetical protein